MTNMDTGKLCPSSGQTVNVNQRRDGCQSESCKGYGSTGCICRIRELNDKLRTTISGGLVHMTNGVAALGLRPRWRCRCAASALGPSSAAVGAAAAPSGSMPMAARPAFRDHQRHAVTLAGLAPDGIVKSAVRVDLIEEALVDEGPITLAAAPPLMFLGRGSARRHRSSPPLIVPYMLCTRT